MFHIPRMQTPTPPQAEEAALRAAFAVAHISAQRREAQARMTAAIIFSILNLLERWYAAWQKTRDVASHPANETDAPLAAPHWESVLCMPLAAPRQAGTPCAIRLAVAARPARAPPCTDPRPGRSRLAPRRGAAPTPRVPPPAINPIHGNGTKNAASRRRCRTHILFRLQNNQWPGGIPPARMPRPATAPL